MILFDFHSNLLIFRILLYLTQTTTAKLHVDWLSCILHNCQFSLSRQGRWRVSMLHNDFKSLHAVVCLPIHPLHLSVCQIFVFLFSFRGFPSVFVLQVCSYFLPSFSRLSSTPKKIKKIFPKRRWNDLNATKHGSSFWGTIQLLPRQSRCKTHTFSATQLIGRINMQFSRHCAKDSLLEFKGHPLSLFCCNFPCVQPFLHFFSGLSFAVVVAWSICKYIYTCVHQGEGCVSFG